MKKIIASVIAASMLISTPALARDYNQRNHKEYRQRDRGNGCGWLCGAIIGGIVVGALSSSERERERQYDNRYYPPDNRIDRRYCVREQVTEWYRGERYVYWQTTCN